MVAPSFPGAVLCPCEDADETLVERNVPMLLKVPDVARRLNCSMATVYSLIESKKLPYHRCPGIRVSEEQIAAYLEQTRFEAEATRPPQPRLQRARLKHIRL